MLTPIDLHDHEPPIKSGHFLQHSGPLLPVFRLRMNQMADAARWLGGYFHAAAIILQLPGGADYRPIAKPDLDFPNTVWVDDRRRPMGMLAEVLRRLGSEKLLAQLPNGEGPSVPPAAHVKRRLNRLTRAQLVCVAANCLDRLLVAPHLPHMRRFHGESLEGKTKRKK